jgi:glycosyltransferase involved in cell wall biosynthesis
MLLGGGHPDYEAKLRRMVAEAGLEKLVHFRATVAKEEMPALMAQNDILIFPSIYEEPLARMTQEAMAAGLVVVGTTTGGTKEILVEGENGLTFAADNPVTLADQLAKLVAHPELLPKLAQAGRDTVLEKFTLHRMVSEIEAYLKAIHAYQPTIKTTHTHPKKDANPLPN